MSDTTYVTKLPNCDIHKYVDGKEVTAKYDLRTKDGRWANVCEDHRTTDAMYPVLGTGKGQLLIEGEKPESTTKNEEISAAMRRGDLAAVEELIGDGDIAEWL